MAVARGRSVEIPIIFRQLGIIFKGFGSRSAFKGFDLDYIVVLDAGTDPDDLAAVAPSYHNQWWVDNAAPSADSLISGWTLDECLEHHREVTGIKEILPSTPLKTAYTWSRQVISPDGSGIDLDCQRCRLYRGVALSLQENYQELQRQADALAVLQGGNADAFARRAAILFQLYEAAAAKDIPPPIRTMTPKSSGSHQSTKTRAQNVAAAAVVEFKRLQNVPQVKWLWGPTLNRQDVLLAVKPPFNAGEIHSGYVTSLPEDSQGQQSDLDDSVCTDAIFSDIGQDNMDVPELVRDEYPHHFCFPPLRHDYAPPIEGQPITAADAANLFNVPTAPTAANLRLARGS